MDDQEHRIAMWSGPRNISTALMRSWGNRPDTFVCDEPLYAYYLQQTGLDHPGAAETIEHHETDWKKVVEWITGPIPQGRRVFYQKHMAHHVLPEVGLDWLDRVTSCFLIRQPADMITSLIRFIPQPTLQDTGVPQQLRIFEHVCRMTGQQPVVIDSKDVLMNPEAMLSKLCERIGLEFTGAMLSWPPGLRETDGVWARHWYTAVEKTTGFAPYKPKNDIVPDALQDVVEQCDQMYQIMYEQRLTVD